MDSPRRWLPVLALAIAPAAWAAGDYIGVLRPTSKPNSIAIPEPGFYWPLAGPFGVGLGADTVKDGFKLKLGYRYSPYLAVETGYVDSGSATFGDPLGGSQPRGKGFSMDTVGTVPLWRHAALYGRLGAWRSDSGAALLYGGETGARPGAGLRYGLGLKYDFTRGIGMRAELGRFSPIDRWGGHETDTDQVSVGVTWRF